MLAAGNAMPLLSLDAVAIDTETTGLDPARARIVEVAAIRIVSGIVQPTATFHRLVRPPEMIPAAAVAIHGIDDTAVAGAADFAGIWSEFSDFIARSVVIGHMVGFDLAVLKRECERAGTAFKEMRTLDTGLLARIAMPGLGDFSLDSVAQKLGIEITNRHSALGDATAAAAVFRALIAGLREKNIRTIGEATRACHALAPALDNHRQAGWADVTADVQIDDDFGRIDTFPYRHRVRDIMSVPPVSAGADTSLASAISTMVGEKISSLYVRPLGADSIWLPSGLAGIFTERDALRAFAEYGASALAMPIEKFASRPLVSIPSEAFVYRAIGRMDRFKIRHLAVHDADGLILGALSARDLLHLRAGQAISLSDEIDHATDVYQLGRAWAKLPRVAASLLAENVSGRDIAKVISQELCALTRQAAVIAETRIRNEGHGNAPCPYAVAVLGSAARGESLLALDQDNAIIFAEGIPGGHEDRWFQKLGHYFSQILHEVGVPYCKGGVMASNPQWRGSSKTWEDRIASWIGRSRPDDLLSVDIFFDMLGVHGETGIAEALWRHGFDAAKGNAAFAKLLADAAGTVEPGLGLFGGFKLDRGRIDLKMAGLFGIVTTARVLAICHHIVERSTPERLTKLKSLQLHASSDLEALLDAQDVFLGLMLAQQVEDIKHGKPATNAVSVKRITRQNQERLHRALQSVGCLDELVTDLLFSD